MSEKVTSNCNLCLAFFIFVEFLIRGSRFDLGKVISCIFLSCCQGPPGPSGPPGRDGADGQKVKNYSLLL